MTRQSDDVCGGDMSTPHNRTSTRHYLLTTSDNRRSVRISARWDQARAPCRSGRSARVSVGPWALGDAVCCRGRVWRACWGDGGRAAACRPETASVSVVILFRHGRSRRLGGARRWGDRTCPAGNAAAGCSGVEFAKAGLDTAYAALVSLPERLPEFLALQLADHALGQRFGGEDHPGRLLIGPEPAGA